jgi:hypothetical protein
MKMFTDIDSKDGALTGSEGGGSWIGRMGRALRWSLQ